ALTRGDAEGAPAPDAQTLLELLVSADAALVEVVDEPELAANATVVVAPRTEETGPEHSPDAADLETPEQRLAEEVALVCGVVAAGDGGVVASPAATEPDLGSAVRADWTAEEPVATTASVSEISGRLSVPLALGVDISAEVGHFGVGSEAT